MSPEAIAIELPAPTGETLRFAWPAGPWAGDGGGWRLEGEVDWEEVEALRIVSAALPDGRGLALAAVRRAGAAGHGEEAIGAVLVSDGTPQGVAEPLLSVEHGADGMPRRIGLELHGTPDPLPLRIAAEVSAVSHEAEGELAHIRAELAVRLEGKRSAGRYEVLRPHAGANPAW